jgi:hypothetical protein
VGNADAFNYDETVAYVLQSDMAERAEALRTFVGAHIASLVPDHVKRTVSDDVDIVLILGKTTKPL